MEARGWGKANRPSSLARQGSNQTAATGEATVALSVRVRTFLSAVGHSLEEASSCVR